MKNQQTTSNIESLELKKIKKKKKVVSEGEIKIIKKKKLLFTKKQNFFKIKKKYL